MTERKAVFSTDRKYRYSLEIWWGDFFGPRLNFLMLNPSTADEVSNDPTVERCERRARMWGYSGVIITNLFAYRATDPQELYKLDKFEALGNKFRGHYTNNDHILSVACKSEATIVGWGQHGKLHGRQDEVKKFMSDIGMPLYYLKINSDGTPTHPLFVKYSLTPQLWQ